MAKKKDVAEIFAENIFKDSKFQEKWQGYLARFGADINDYDPANKIILELTSTVDQSVYISLFCSQSGDNLAEGDAKDLTLQAGKPETVELTFGGWKDFNYWIDIKVDNTRINLRIEP